MNSPAQAIVTTNERVTGPPGVEMLKLANINQQTELEVLDLACGGGIISSELIDKQAEQGAVHHRQYWGGKTV